MVAPAYVELFLSAGKRVIPASLGKDEYASSVTLASHSRVAATGRKCLFLNHQRPAYLYQAGPAELVDMTRCLSRQEGFHLFMSSSLPLTPGQLARDFCLKVVTIRESRIMMCDHSAIEYSGNGKFVIHMGSFPQRM